MNSMPTATLHATPPPRGTVMEGPPVPEDGGAQAAILVVDDREDKRTAMAAVLAEMQLPVVLAESGTEALRHLLREDFSLILLDLNMPEMDGIELATIIRSRRRNARTPIIFYTADGDAAQRRLAEAYNLGAVDLLVAPVPAHVLRAKVTVFADFHRRLSDVRRIAGERERLLRAEAARAEAERASAAKDHFLAMLSHELRTPLSPVLNTIELLLDDPDHPPKLRADLELIRRNMALEARLIDDLLDLTRVSRGKVNLLLETLDVHECLQRVVRICAPEMELKQVTVEVRAEAAHSQLRADVARLKQVLWNLIRNAVKYSEAGGQIVVTTSDADGSRLRLDVRDTGCGISPDLLPGIFDAFRQGAHTTGGLGLGLAISRSLVELHGGTIEACSEGQGCGATFTVYLPLSGPVFHPPTSDQVRPASPVAMPRLPARILLVEDHADSRLTLDRILQRRGYTVETAVDVRSALELTGKHCFDVIISDIGLPDGTGHDFVSQLPAKDRARAIALSGFGMEEDVVRSTASGFVRHLTKPVNFPELDATIQSLLAEAAGR